MRSSSTTVARAPCLLALTWARPGIDRRRCDPTGIQGHRLSRQNFIISATHTHSSNTRGLGQGAPPAKTVADAIVEAATIAKRQTRAGAGRLWQDGLDLNVNRDLFNRRLEWRQEPNPQGPSDKTLAVVEILGDDNVPIGVYMNYAMHPINFYLSGVISADFPGEASRYVEELFERRTVAIFSQGAVRRSESTRLPITHHDHGAA